MNHPTITSQVVSQFVNAILTKKPAAAPLAREICDKHVEIVDRAVTARRREIAMRGDVIIERVALELMTSALRSDATFAADYANLSR